MKEPQTPNRYEDYDHEDVDKSIAVVADTEESASFLWWLYENVIINSSTKFLIQAQTLLMAFLIRLDYLGIYGDDILNLFKGLDKETDTDKMFVMLKAVASVEYDSDEDDPSFIMPGDEVVAISKGEQTINWTRLFVADRTNTAKALAKMKEENDLPDGMSQEDLVRFILEKNDIEAQELIRPNITDGLGRLFARGKEQIERAKAMSSGNATAEEALQSAFYEMSELNAPSAPYLFKLFLDGVEMISMEHLASLYLFGDMVPENIIGFGHALSLGLLSPEEVVDIVEGRKIVSADYAIQMIAEDADVGQKIGDVLVKEFGDEILYLVSEGLFNIR